MMSSPTAVLVYARTLPLLTRLPLLLNDVIALPLCIVGGNIPGIVFISLSIPMATVDLLICLRQSRSRRAPVEESQVRVSVLRILVDALMSTGLLITWIISLIEDLGHGWYYNNVSIIACFTVFLAWSVFTPISSFYLLHSRTNTHRLSHTTSLLAQFYFWTWTTKKQHICQHCGHRPDSLLGVETPRSIDTSGPDSDDEATCYNEDQDGEDALLLKVDAEA